MARKTKSEIHFCVDVETLEKICLFQNISFEGQGHWFHVKWKIYLAVSLKVLTVE